MGGGPPWVNVTVYVFGTNSASYGAVCFQPSGSTCLGTIVYNGGVVVLGTGTTYPIQAWGVQSSTVTWEWTSNAGTVFSPTSASTAFYTSSGGDLDLDLGYNSHGSWSGYLLGAYGLSETYVSGTWRVPSASFVSCTWWLGGQCPGGGEDASAWVGLGGFSYGTIWQAGVDVVEYSNGVGGYSETPEAWYEMYTGSSSTQHWITPSTFPISVGDSVTSEVFTAGGNSYYDIIDNTKSTYASGSVSGSAPTTDGAEWILEDPKLTSGAYIVMPSFASFAFTNPSVTVTCTGYTCAWPSGQWLMPLLAQQISLTNNCGYSCTVTQDVVPGYLSSPNYSSFTETYS
jgi:hypothetical protein